MIRRQGERSEPEGPEPTTYLGLAVAAPEVGGRFGARPMVVGATEMVVLPGPAWCHDPTGQEPPLGIDISEMPALGGASEPLRCVEISEAVSVGQEGGANGEQR